MYNVYTDAWNFAFRRFFFVDDLNEWLEKSKNGTIRNEMRGSKKK